MSYLVLGVLGLLVVSLVILLAQVDDWSRDLTMSSAELQVELPGTVDQAVDQLRSWLKDQPQWSEVSCDHHPNRTQMKLIRTTSLLRFKDDVVLNFEATTVDVILLKATSQSRIGKADFGQNPRNLRELLSGLR